ncbi:radical SAM/SPASM domain-containing protein [Chloroflexota bacterium]
MTNPIYIDWVITSQCNLNCRHCVGMEQGELSHDEAVKIANDIIGLTPNWVILEGGEPLMRPDLPEIGRMFHEAGIDVFMITNGNAFTLEKLQELTSFSPKILFSIDGADPEVYEYTKTGARFETAIEWAGKCAELGIFQGITVVLSKLNLAQIGDLMRLTENLGGKSIIFLPLKPPFSTDQASIDYYEKYTLSPREQESAVMEIYGMESNLEVFYDEPFVWNLAARNGLTLDSSNSGITIPEVQGCAASYSLYIQATGGVRPCMFSPEELTFGNVTREPLEKIWLRMKNSDILTKWACKSERIGACAECSQFDSCRGCLARTTRLMGNALESDPACPFVV